MEEIRIGTSDIIIKPLGIGAMSWSNSAIWGYGSKLSHAAGKEAFETSVEAGVQLFDTAEIYGNGHSERVLGKLVRESQTPVYVATKYAPLPWRLSSRALTRALEKSLKRLGLDKVDLYQIHFPMGVVSIEKLMEAMADAVEAGKIRYVGVSNYNADQMNRAQDALAKRGLRLVSNQVEYSLIHRSPEVDGVLDTCREMDITLIAYSPLGRGALTGKYRPGQGPEDARRFYRQFQGAQFEELAPLLTAMQEISTNHGGVSLSQIALNWLIRQTQVLPIPGAKNTHQAQDNINALTWQMTDEEANLLEERSRSFRKAVEFRFRPE